MRIFTTTVPYAPTSPLLLHEPRGDADVPEGIFIENTGAFGVYIAGAGTSATPFPPIAERLLIPSGGKRRLTALYGDRLYASSADESTFQDTTVKLIITDFEALEEPGATGGGVTDHGVLTGLADDDHPQYLQDGDDPVTLGLDSDSTWDTGDITLPTSTPSADGDIAVPGDATVLRIGHTGGFSSYAPDRIWGFAPGVNDDGVNTAGTGTWQGNAVGTTWKTANVRYVCVDNTTTAAKWLVLATLDGIGISGTAATTAQGATADTALQDITAEGLIDLGDVTDGTDGQHLVRFAAGDFRFESPGGGASELVDLSDVITAADTDKFVLVADGSGFDARLLVETDISDLGTYPNITSGAGPPSSTPTKVGDTYVDTTADTVWSAVGTASVDDWRLVTQDVFNVLEYGATGDGSTDDTTAIQAAIDAAATAGGGTVFFPATSTFYVFTSTLTMDDGVVLAGSGTGLAGTSTIMYTSSGSGVAIDCSEKVFLGFRDLSIGYNSATYTGTLMQIGTAGPPAIETSGCSVVRCNFGGTATQQNVADDVGAMNAEYLIAFSGASVWYFQDCRFVAAEVAIVRQTFTADSVTFTGCFFHPTIHVAVVESCGNSWKFDSCKVHGSIVVGGGDPVDRHPRFFRLPPVTNAVANMTVINTQFIDTAGASTEWWFEWRGASLTIIGCLFSQVSSGGCLRITGTSNSVFLAGNRFATDNRVLVDAFLPSIVVVGNDTSGAPTPTAPTVVLGTGSITNVTELGQYNSLTALDDDLDMGTKDITNVGLVDGEDVVAVAALGATALQPASIDTLAELNAIVTDATLVDVSHGHTVLDAVPESLIVGRIDGSGTGDSDNLTPAQAKTILAISEADITDLVHNAGPYFWVQHLRDISIPNEEWVTLPFNASRVDTDNQAPRYTAASTIVGAATLPQATITLASTSGFYDPSSPVEERARAFIDIVIGGVSYIVRYTGITGNDLTGCTGATGTFVGGEVVEQAEVDLSPTGAADVVPYLYEVDINVAWTPNGRGARELRYVNYPSALVVFRVDTPGLDNSDVGTQHFMPELTGEPGIPAAGAQNVVEVWQSSGVELFILSHGIATPIVMSAHQSGQLP